MLESNRVVPVTNTPPPVVRRGSSLDILRGITQSSFDAAFGKIEYSDVDERQKSWHEQLRLKCLFFLESTLIGYGYQQFMLAISVLSCFQFIYQTYLDPDTERGAKELLIFSKTELALAILFLFDWCLRFFVSEHKLQHFTSFFSLVDLMTVIPIFALYNGHQCPTIHQVHVSKSFDLIVYYILCGMSTTRILRALRFRRHFLQMEDEVKRFLANMCLYVIVMILFNAALMHYLEPQQKLPFHTWTYYMLVTMATVGYGDISPKTDLGRFAAMAMISFAIVSVPKMTNELIEKMNLHSVYARALYTPKMRNTRHIVICGDTKSVSLEEFFEELFHEDHEADNLHAVIIQPHVPTHDMTRILTHSQFSLCVTYLEGNTFSDKDLKRARVETAKAIFIMTNKFSADPDEEDAKAILQQFSIQRYLRLNSSLAKQAFCMQLIRPENKRHLVSSGISGEDAEFSDLVVCMNEIKMGVIAKAVLFPGANALIMNLLSTFADDEDDDKNKTIDSQLEIETLEDDEDADWMGEYQRGCDWEIYNTELSNAFEGTVFCALSEILYQKLGVVLFGLEVEDLRKEKPESKTLLNPADFIIPSKKDFKISAFVIAKNKAQSDLTFSKIKDQDQFVAGGLSLSHLSVLANPMTHIRNSFLSGGGGNINNNNGGNTISNDSDHNNNNGSADYGSPSRSNRQPYFNNNKRGKPAWKQLLKSCTVAEKTTESQQEAQQRMEDLHLRENYYIRDHIADLPDVMIRSSVMVEMPHMENHVIIIGKALSNLYDLVRPLRSKHLGVLKHIVIVYPHDFPIAVWQRICIFESIWIVRGSALEEADIRRAGIFKARQVVVLAESAEENEIATGASSAGLDALVDADAIFCYQCVKRMNELAQVVVEIVRHKNVRYLDPESGNQSQIDYKFTPQFASGVLFNSSFLDTLVCQAYYNPKIIDVVNKLISSADSKEFNATDRRGNRSTMIGSSLYQINIPDGLESRTYGALYKLLSKRQMIPLGILRGVFPHTKLGPKGNKMPYVFTNPPKDTELFTCDKIFVLSQRPIHINKGVLEDKEIHVKHVNRYRKKTTEDIIQNINVLRDDIKLLDHTQLNLESKLASITYNFTQKFDQLCNALELKHLSSTYINSNNNNSNSNNHYNLHVRTNVPSTTNSSNIGNNTNNNSNNNQANSPTRRPQVEVRNNSTRNINSNSNSS